MKISTILPVFLLTVTSASLLTANEAIHRDATLDELQSALGYFVTTTEIKLDSPKYGRFVLIKESLEGREEDVLRDLHFSATYFRFLNITDAREARVNPKKRPSSSIQLSCWKGEKREYPQGWSYQFEDLSEGLSGYSGSSSSLKTTDKIDPEEEITIWKETVEGSGAEFEQALVLRFSDSRWGE